MKNKFILKISITLFCSQTVLAQDCKTDADVASQPGKYLTAAQYPWPAVRAEYFNNLTTAADKSIAKKTLTQIENIEQKTHNGFALTGGNWENFYSTKGYQYFANTKLGQYSFEAALHEYFCAKGKLTRNSEYSTVLRIYTNEVTLNSLDAFISYPFGSSFGSYDFGMQYADWKNHNPADVNAKLIPLFTYLSCNNTSLLERINSGTSYFQDVAEKDIKPNNRSNYIYRYWFIKKKDLPVLIPVSRKDYLESLLEYYDREKIYFTKLVAELKADRDNSIKYYTNWEADVNDKIAVVKKAMSEHDATWLSAQAVVNPANDNSQTYNAKLPEQTNYHRFWKFYDGEKKAMPLYTYNPEYFKKNAQTPAAKPQVITVAFRYNSMPLSLRLIDNFTRNFDFSSLNKLVE
mgnify:CR=1 FL=1